MNIITRRTLIYYINKFPLASNALKTWYDEMSKASFENFNELKETYGNASIVANNRVVFNIKGNSFRLVIAINFQKQAAYVIWFGIHAEYDKIDVAAISFKKTD
jgi:mRNA interferase HigB